MHTLMTHAHQYTHALNYTHTYTDDDISFHVNQTKLEKSGDWVTVSWDNVSPPEVSDWIGVYSPPINGSIDPFNHAPIKFQV